MKKSKLLKLVGKRIKKVRESKNITQLQLVIDMEEEAGKFDTTNVSRIESGRTGVATKSRTNFLRPMLHI